MCCHAAGGGEIASQTRTTICFQPQVCRALKVKAATSDRSLSALVNAAAIAALREDADDLEAFDARKRKPPRPFEKALDGLRRDGLV